VYESELFNREKEVHFLKLKNSQIISTVPVANEYNSMIINAFYLFIFSYSIMEIPFCLKMLYNIYYMTSRASLPEYFPPR
jgi:hypothetical protein